MIKQRKDSSIVQSTATLDPVQPHEVIEESSMPVVDSVMKPFVEDVLFQCWSKDIIKSKLKPVSVGNAIQMSSV